MTPRCPRCGAAMLRRHNRATGLPFWGCPAYPRCRGTVAADAPGSGSSACPGRDPGAGPAPDTPGTELATLQQQLRQVTRERDTLQAGYAELLDEVRQLRRKRPPPAPMDALVRELTRLLSVIHPDKWGGESAVATALTQEVVALRERLQEGRHG